MGDQRRLCFSFDVTLVSLDADAHDWLIVKWGRLSCQSFVIVFSARNGCRVEEDSLRHNTEKDAVLCSTTISQQPFNAYKTMCLSFLTSYIQSFHSASRIFLSFFLYSEPPPQPQQQRISRDKHILLSQVDFCYCHHGKLKEMIIIIV